MCLLCVRVVCTVCNLCVTFNIYNILINGYCRMSVRGYEVSRSRGNSEHRMTSAPQNHLTLIPLFDLANKCFFFHKFKQAEAA